MFNIFDGNGPTLHVEKEWFDIYTSMVDATRFGYVFTVFRCGRLHKLSRSYLEVGANILKERSVYVNDWRCGKYRCERCNKHYREHDTRVAHIRGLLNRHELLVTHANLAWLVKTGAKQDARFRKDLARYYSSIDELFSDFKINGEHGQRHRSG